MMRDDAWETYEGWRRLWLSGRDSNAIAAMCFHGLWGALAMVEGARNRARPPSTSSAVVERTVADAVIAEAAGQVRRLLRVSSAPVSGHKGERHV